MNESQAREVLLLQAFESVPDDHPQWTVDDRRWASRAAAQAVGAGAPREAFVVERARLAMQRLAPREPAVRRLLAGAPLPPAALAGAVLGVGALVGLATDQLVAGDYFNLLSLPFWGLLAWNLAVYAWLAVAALRGGAAGPGRRAAARAWRAWRISTDRIARASPLAGFGARWAEASAGLGLSRAAVVLHLAAAGIALGLVGGMLLRGLVLDYRAGWATTLLEPATVHAVLSAALAPAFALSGSGAPAVAAFEALRVVPGRPADASAAPWMLWMSLQLAIVVIVPRLLLAAAAAWRARRRARALPLSLTGPYFDRLQPPAAPQILWVLPHAQAPDAQAVLGLRGLLATVWGESPALQVAPPLPYGDEEQPPVPPPGALPIVLVDLAATPEPDVHGRLLAALAGAGRTPLLLADEGGFVRRFGRGARLAERSAAWRALAQQSDAGFVAADLGAPDAAAGESALRQALRHVPEAPA
jgi:hypothetical protein